MPDKAEDELNSMDNLQEPEEYAGTQLLKLRVDADLYRAFQRCVWIIVNETGRTQMDIMNEVIRDFLVKKNC